MIRRDYFMRLVQEMAQILARVVLLKHRREYEQAMREIGDALKSLHTAQEPQPEPTTLDAWLRICHKHGQAASGLMLEHIK